MPSAKSARGHDDSKVEASHAKDKNGAQLSSTKMRRITSQTGSSNLREVTNASSMTSVPQAVPETTAPPTIKWSSFDRDALHAYRREYNLDTPPSFKSTYHQAVLSRPGSIGLYSPTMAGRRQSKRQTKEQLAMAVRKHFNALGVQENDVIVDLVHKTRNEHAINPGAVKR